MEAKVRDILIRKISRGGAKNAKEEREELATDEYRFIQIAFNFVIAFSRDDR